jgi:hypothetical protein
MLEAASSLPIVRVINLDRFSAHTLCTRLARCFTFVRLLTHHSHMHMRMQLAQKCSSTKAGALKQSAGTCWSANYSAVRDLPGCVAD